jgi:hypothetical protein
MCERSLTLPRDVVIRIGSENLLWGYKRIAEQQHDTLPRSWRANTMVSMFAAAFNDGLEQGNHQVQLAPSESSPDRPTMGADAGHHQICISPSMRLDLSRPAAETTG